MSTVSKGSPKVTGSSAWGQGEERERGDLWDFAFIKAYSVIIWAFPRGCGLAGLEKRHTKGGLIYMTLVLTIRFHHGQKLWDQWYWVSGMRDKQAILQTTTWGREVF